MFHLLAELVLRILIAVVRRVPATVALQIGEAIGIFGYMVVPKRRRISLENLRFAFPEKKDSELRRIVFGMAKNLGRNMMEFLRLPAMKLADINRYIEFEGLENLDKALAEGKGVFILTAHFGNWDLLAASMAFKGYRTNLVTKYLKSELLNKLWLDYRKQVKVNIMYREGSLKDIIRHLKANEIMGFVLDQNTKREEGVFVNFFGRPACTIPSLSTLSERLDVPVVPGFIIRKHGAYHKVVYEPALTFQKRDNLEESIVYNTQIYSDVMERYIRQYPDHWIWLHRRWKTQHKSR
ncbi:MAG: lysophospholipid acyltransferase family protein [Planctomycetes bacterium]|nr:lysophospholipid acyltransferase family protein [Planctomycetota bacterium]